MNQKPRSGDVPQELVAEPLACRRSLNESGDVGKDVAREVAEVRLKRRELIRADLGARSGERV